MGKSVFSKALNTIDKARDLTGGGPVAYITAAQLGWELGQKAVSARERIHEKSVEHVTALNQSLVPERWTRATGSIEVAGRAIVNPQTLRGIAVITGSTGMSPDQYGNDKPAQVDNRLRTVLLDTSIDANKSKHWYDDSPDDDFITRIVKTIARALQWQ